GLLGHTFAKAGTYALGVRDRELRGGASMSYRLNIGELPIVTAVFPLGLKQGSEAEIRVDGVFLDTNRVKVKAPADAPLGSKITVPVTSSKGKPLGQKSVIVGEFPE